MSLLYFLDFYFKRKGDITMAEIKDKVVTVEALSILHEDSKRTYMPTNNPTGSGTMTMDGSANFSGDVNVGSITIGSNVRLVPTGDRIEIIFLEEETMEEIIEEG